jgi:hypothetical protein
VNEARAVIDEAIRVGDEATELGTDRQDHICFPNGSVGVKSNGAGSSGDNDLQGSVGYLSLDLDDPAIGGLGSIFPAA